jgi:nucleoid-associated protein YgaU
MKKNPLAIFIGLALVTSLGLAGVTKDRWYPDKPQKVALVPPAPSETSKPAEPAAEAPAPIPEHVAVPADEQAAPPAVEQVTAPAAKLAEAPTVEQTSGPTAEGSVAAAKPATEQQTAAVAPAEPAVAPAEPAVAPAEPAVAVPPQPEATTATPQSAAAEAPGFDTVRVEKTGEAVIAGRAVAGSEVVIKLNGQPIGSATSNQDGNFVVVPEQPLPPGAGALTLEVKPAGSGGFKQANETVAVAVPSQSQQEAMVAMVSPDQPTQVLQTPGAAATPEAPKAAAIQPETTAPAEAPEAAAAPETAAPATAPAAPAKAVSLDVVDYDDQGNIVFSGRAAAGAAVRLYVDNAAVGEASSGADGRWNFAGTAQITPGTHMLRADEIDAAGAVASRVELPFFREEAAKVAAAEPETPTATAPEAQSDVPATTAPEIQPQVPAATASEAQPEAPAAATPEAQVKTATAPEIQPAAPVATTPAAQGEATTAPEIQPEAPAAETQVATAAAAEPQPKQGRIIIQPGNNLWRISRVVYGSGVKYTVIYEANKDHIRDPDLIYPGQIFKTPDVVPPEQIDPKRRTPLTQQEGGAVAQP